MTKFSAYPALRRLLGALILGTSALVAARATAAPVAEGPGGPAPAGPSAVAGPLPIPAQGHGPMAAGMASPLGLPLHAVLPELKLTSAQDAALQRAELASAKRHIAERHDRERAHQAVEAALADPNVKLSDALRLRQPKLELLEQGRREELDAWIQFVDSLDSRQSAVLRNAAAAQHPNSGAMPARGRDAGPRERMPAAPPQR